MKHFLVVGLVSCYLGWRMILQKGAYPANISTWVKYKHFISLVIIGVFCWNFWIQLLWLFRHLGELEAVYSKSFRVFNPRLNVLLDFAGSLTATCCMGLCFGAAMRHKQSLKFLRLLLPLLASYFAFSIVREVVQREYPSMFTAVGAVVLMGIPVAAILCFYYKQENVDQLCGGDFPSDY